MKQGKHEGLGNADSRMHRRTNFDDQNKKIIKSKNSSTAGNFFFFFDYLNEYCLLQRKKTYECFNAKQLCVHRKIS